MSNKLFRFLFFFFLFLILLQFFSKKETGPSINPADDIAILGAEKFVQGAEVIVEIENRKTEKLAISNPCPRNPLLVEFYRNGEWIKKESILKDSGLCKDKPTEFTAESGKKVKIGFGLWNADLFGEQGRYRISYEGGAEGKIKQYFHEFNIVPPSFLHQAWNTALYKPILNTLFLLVSKIPGHNLGLAIILLTLIIKLILLGPNQKALKSQKQMQRIQPELEALKIKHKDNPQVLAQETMAIWKKNKVSPLGSCLPMLIQFPVLIALFYVVRDGLNIIDPGLLYGPLKTFNLQLVNPFFLGLDLTKMDYIFLPVIVGGLQFLQIRLSLGKIKKTPEQPGNSPLPAMNAMMQYVMPVMIAVFTASLPGAVGFYWGVSTLFGIGQQLIVNYSKT